MFSFPHQQGNLVPGNFHSSNCFIPFLLNEHEKTKNISVVHQSSTVLNILKNPWFIRFTSQIMALAFLIALKIKFVKILILSQVFAQETIYIRI